VSRKPAGWGAGPVQPNSEASSAAATSRLI